MLETGIPAPNFSLPDQDGVLRNLSDWKGKRVVLYFYSKDNTSGCTKQACGYASLYSQFQKKGVDIIGVSKDSILSHKKFEKKYDLPFTLLSDTELKVLQAYDVWKEKHSYGKFTMGTVRTSYLIDENGIIVKALGKVKSTDNAEQMLELV